MKKRVISIFLAVSMVTILLVGCGDSSGKTTQSTGTVEDAKTGGEVTNIKFQTWNPGEGAAIQEVIAAFETENPNIKVEYVFMPYTDHVEKLKVDLASGDAADVYGMQTGAIMKEFRDFQMDLTAYAAESWGAEWQSKYLDFCMDLLNEDGKYYGMPLGLTYAGFIWSDVNLLKQYGLEVPQNYNDLTKCAKVLREKGQYPVAIGAKDAWINIDVWMNIANDLNSEKLYAAIEGKTPFTENELVESFKIWQSLFQQGIVQDGALGVSMYTDVTDLFEKEGSIPMYFNGSWAGGSYVNGDPDCEKVYNSPESDHEVRLLDWNNDGKEAPLAAGIDVVLCMNSNSKNADASWKFIDFMMHEGQDILINKYFNYCPSRQDLELKVEGMSEDGNKNLAYILQQSKDNIGGYREMTYAELKQVISDTLTTLALGEITPEQAAQQIEMASQAQAR